MTLLTPLICPSSLASLSSSYIQSGHQQTTLLFYRAGAYPYGLIGQCQAMFRPQSERREESQMDIQPSSVASTSSSSSSSTISSSSSSSELWLWLHPAIYGQVQRAIEQLQQAKGINVQIVPLLGQLCRFELRGHRVHAVLRMAIRAVLSDQDTQREQKAEQKKSEEQMEEEEKKESVNVPSQFSSASSFYHHFLSTYLSPVLLPPHTILSIQVQDPSKLSIRQMFMLQEEKKEKQRGPITMLPTSSPSSIPLRTFGAERTRMIWQQGEEELGEIKGLIHAIEKNDVSPLFCDAWRQRHSELTRWGKHKKRMGKILCKEKARSMRNSQAQTDVGDGCIDGHVLCALWCRTPSLYSFY